MALKIISFIFVISLAYGIAVPTQVKDVSFDVNPVREKERCNLVRAKAKFSNGVNDVINRVSPHYSKPPIPSPNP